MAASAVTCLLAIAFALPPSASADEDPAVLVGRLGASRFAEREAAGEALVKRGRAALPALSGAQRNADPEIRGRARILMARIEAAALVEATLVPLNIRDRPLAEAVAAIARESRMTIVPGVAPPAPGQTVTVRSRSPIGWPERPVTVESSRPVPFWEAVDRLCDAGGLQRAYPSSAMFGAAALVDPSEMLFSLKLIAGRARPPTSDHGALRVELLRICDERRHGYDDTAQGFSPLGAPVASQVEPGTGVIVSSSFRAELMVSAEPRIRIIGVGAVEQAEAVDAEDRSLVKTPTAQEREWLEMTWRINPHLDPRQHPHLRFGAGRSSSTRQWLASVPLVSLSPQARTIARLRGRLPVAVLARRDDPLCIDLKDAEGKTATAGPSRITIHTVKEMPASRSITVELTLQTEPQRPDQRVVVHQANNGIPLAVNEPLDQFQIQLEFVDAEGESLLWQFARAPRMQQMQGRMAVTVRRRNFQPVRLDGVRLRYFEVVGAAVDLPFTFTDIPTP